jgi:hypothetical protein
MISMILLVQHVVEATNEDGARPKVTGGSSITPIMQRPGALIDCNQLRLQLTQIEKSGLRVKRGRIPGSRGDPGFNNSGVDLIWFHIAFPKEEGLSLRGQ